VPSSILLVELRTPEGGQEHVTKERREDLLLEWRLYGYVGQKEIVAEYLGLCCCYYSQKGFLGFLKDRLQIEGHCNLGGFFW
jgi:hypothetical protein